MAVEKLNANAIEKGVMLIAHPIKLPKAIEMPIPIKTPMMPPVMLMTTASATFANS